MNSVDQIKPFVPTHRVKRPQSPKKRKDEKSKRKPGPRDGHRVDELA